MKKLFVVASLLVAAPALASTGDNATSGNAPAAERAETEAGEANETQPSEAGDRRICRNVDYGAGSRVSSRRVCMTADQWRAQRRR